MTDWERDIFDNSLAYVLGKEGVYSNDPKDPGGETLFGVSRVHNPAWPGWEILKVDGPADGFQNASPAMKDAVRELYRGYWVDAGCPKVLLAGFSDDERLALCTILLDCAVNQGPDDAVKALQWALGVRVDGDFGEKTMQALMMEDAREISVRVMIHRAALYGAVDAKSATPGRYINGWKNRAAATLERALELL